ncbi:Gfo/Idh/MocA family oxidoreductase [Sediminibacterium sp.]|uniref:Gfo/Idh/MocA family oxidoreductase n=1 Tax=Sediminibacterium sp. TaxID=1917865 RepID=UPI0027330DF8|nr:Gfo/Idh/MocA family oxidoreductase [Sediminibacterium sp.]MDP3394036.1 Gfo/Idh/MocA family oxidoreductase [Sediminibacterium sp.]
MKNNNYTTTPIKTAILSFGMSGKVFHAPFIHHNEKFELTGIVERSKNEATVIYPNTKIYRSIDSVLADESIELIVVNTPTYTHFEFAKKALEKGKHIIVEKAFTTTAEEAKILTDLANEKELVLSVYQNRRWDSDFSTVKQIVDNQQIGTVISAEFHFDRFKEAISPKTHKESPNAGAGLLLDLGPHLIDQAVYLFGMPQAVMADIRTVRPNSLVDDDFTLILYYTQLRVTLKSSLLVREPLPAYIIHGNKGSFIKTRADIQEAALIRNAIPYTENWGQEPDSEMGYLHTQLNGEIIKENIPTLKGNYGAFYDGLYNTIINNAPCLVGGQDGLNVMKLIEAAKESHVTGKIIQINP